MSRLQRIMIAASVAIIVLGCALSAQEVLSTSIDFDNGQNGVMFDVRPTGGHLRITAIDAVMDYGNQTVQVWRTTNGATWLGQENDASLWTLCGQNTVWVPNSAAVTPLGIPLDIEVPNGSYQGLYVTITGGSSGLNYTDGTNLGGLRAQTPYLELYEGCGKSYPFGLTYGSTTPGGASRMFNGNIHYSLFSTGAAASIGFGTGISSATGVVFDVHAKEAVTVEGFKLWLEANTHDLEVWTPRLGGSALTVYTDPSKWMRVGRVTGFNAPVNGGYDVGFDLDVPIGINEVRGFYVTRTTTAANDLFMDPSPVSYGDVVASDVSVDVLAGFSCDYFITGFGAAGAVPVAQIKYRRNVTAGLYSLSTATLPATDGPNRGPGLFFDLSAVNDFVQVKAISTYLYPGTHTVELWTVKDRTTHIGKETNAALWSLAATTTLTVAGTDVLTPVFNDLRIVLEPGRLQGCYITTTGGTSLDIGYSFATKGVIFNSDSYVAVHGGSRADYPFLPTHSDRGPDLEILTLHSAVTLTTVVDDFGTGGTTTPPYGWMTHLSDGDNIGQDGWRFDNPQPIYPAALPAIDSSFAVVDTDYAGSGNPVDACLYSPRINTSAGKTLLSFDHYHRPLNSVIYVEVWDGTVWNAILATTAGTANPEHFTADITAAAGYSTKARVRFRYVGNYDWHWAIDNVRIQDVGLGQAPRPGLSVFDLNYAREAHSRPVASNLPGPYSASGYTSIPAVFSFEGEPNQPVLLMHGLKNVAGWDFLSYGKLDIGYYQPTTGTFLYLEQLAYGGDPGYLNSLFVTNSVGRLELAFQLPAFMIGNTYHFQSLILSSWVNSSLSNMVSLKVIN